jgi:hypothetical protein
MAERSQPFLAFKQCVFSCAEVALSATASDQESKLFYLKDRAAAESLLVEQLSNRESFNDFI